MPTIEWRFGESADDGEAWLKRPRHLYVYVEYRDKNGEDNCWRRIMVVTKAWLQKHLESVRLGAQGPLWIVVPTMLVLPDADGEDLRRAVGTAIQEGGLDTYATVTTPREAQA